MKQALRWIAFLALGAAAYTALYFSLRYFFGSVNPLSIFFGLCGLLVIIKVGNWVARRVDPDSTLKKNQNRWDRWYG